MKTAGEGPKVVKSLLSVHVVHYTCANCGEEHEEVKLCTACKAPMKVIQVVELFGEDAAKYLDQLKKGKKEEELNRNLSARQFDDTVLGAESEEMDKEVHVTEEPAAEEVDSSGLTDIFPDDGEVHASAVADDMDFADALDILDQEETSEDIEDIPEL